MFFSPIQITSKVQLFLRSFKLNTGKCQSKDNTLVTGATPTHSKRPWPRVGESQMSRPFGRYQPWHPLTDTCGTATIWISFKCCLCFGSCMHLEEHITWPVKIYLLWYYRPGTTNKLPLVYKFWMRVAILKGVRASTWCPIAAML